MRWVWIASALVVSGIAVADTNGSQKLAASEVEHAPMRPVIEDLADDPDVLEDEPAPPLQKPAKLAEIKGLVAPTKYTDDPVLGRAERVVGSDVRGMIAFTFDDGPRAETTSHILDALKKYDIPASFFIVTKHFGHGRPEDEAKRSKELLARTIAEGHLVGSHGMFHEYLLRATRRDLGREVNDSVEVLSTLAERPIGMFRPAFGKINYAGRKRLKTLGLTEVFWSIDPRDWETEFGEEDELRRHISYMIWNSGGGVIVLHDSKAVTAAIISGVFDDLEAANCRRLANQQTPIYPVSIHYFLRDDGNKPRAVPADVEKRTAAYKAALPDRCAKRAAKSKRISRK